MGSILISIFIVYSIIFLFKSYKDRSLSKKEIYLDKYKNIDFSNSKKAAYLITKYGYFLAKDKKSKEIFEELKENLQKYKYKKGVPNFDEKTIGLYHLFLEILENE